MILGVITAMTFIMASQVLAAKEVPKIGYVDLSRLFDEYEKTKTYDDELESKHREFETTAKEKIEKIKELNSRMALLNEEEKEEANKELEALKADLMEFDRQQKHSLTKERNEKIREILLEIEKIVSDFAQKNDYDLILNDRVLIYGHPTKDVTEEILKVLNDKK